MSLKAKTSIFETGDQYFNGINPYEIKPVGDRLVIKDLGEEIKQGSIFIPGGARRGQIRTGEVVAVGDGDRWLDKGFGRDRQEPRLLSIKTPSGRIPCECKVGDKVFFDHRKDEEIYIDGATYFLVHEEQALLAILE